MAIGDDRLSRLAAEVAPTPDVLRGLSALGWGASGGMLGLEHPDPQVREWQAEHPWLNLAAEMAGFGGFYGLGAKALKATKYNNVLKAIGAGEKLAEAPFKTRALQEMALIAPIEASRQALGAAVGEIGDYEGPTLGERSIEGALNVLAGGAIAGTLGKIASGGKKIKLPESIRDLTTADSFQVNLRKVRQSLEGLENPLERNKVEGLMTDLENQIKSEWRENYVSDLVADPENRLGRLNSLWRGTPKTSSLTLNINQDTGFKTLKGLETVQQEIKDALPEGFADWLDYAQFPRVISPKSAQARAYVDDTLSHTLAPVGSGWYMGQEKNGLFVMAKKIHAQEGADRYLLLKTDAPGKFVPEQAMLKARADRNMWRDPDTVISPTGTKGYLLDDSMNLWDFLDKGVRASQAGNSKVWEATKEGVQAFAEATGLAKVGSRIADSELMNNTISEFKRLFSPTAFQFKNSPKARQIYAFATDLADKARRKAYEGIWGTPTSRESLLGTVFKGTSNLKNSLGQEFREYFRSRPEEFKTFIEEFFSNKTSAQIKETGSLSGKALEFLDRIDALDLGLQDEIKATLAALKAEDKLFEFSGSHHGMSRMWKGTLRQEVVDERGHVVTIFGGNNKKGLVKNAERLIEAMKADGRTLRLGDFWSKNAEIDAQKLKRLSPDLLALSEEYLQRFESGPKELGMPGFTKARTGVEGFHLPATPQEFLDDLAYSRKMRYDWLSREIMEKVAQPEINALGIVDPKTAVALEDKLSVLKGEQGLVGTYVNKLSDKILAPVFGANSASKCVDAFNSAHAILDLGFANISYVLANILQPITTVLPQLSLLHSCPEALQWAYDGIPLISRSGKGTIANIFSPLKMMKEGLRLMAHPELEAGYKEFVDWAVKEGIISPQFTEAYVGQTSMIGEQLKDAWKSGEFLTVIKELASYGSRMSEQLSRGYAMSVGYKFFNSFRRAGQMTQEQVYRATKKFTENTMFQYAASDRATVLQGPVGRAWGLFKNWTMHYAWWQMEYLDAAARKGCFAPLVYSNLATMSLGGLGASELGGVAQGFVEWMGDDKMSNLVYDRWGDTPTSNFILYGLPGLAGWSLKDQVNSPFSDPGEEIQRFMGFVYANRLKAAWNAIGAGIDAWATSGENPLGNAQVQAQLTRAFAPKAIYRSMQMTGDALYTVSGAKVMDGLSASEQIAYKIFNLPSTRIAQGMEISSEIWKDKDKRALLTSKYAEAMSHALDSQDGVLMQRIIERALVDGVDVPSMMHNAQTRMKNSYLSPLERNTDYYSVWGPTAQALGL